MRASTQQKTDPEFEFQVFLERHRGIVFKIANSYCPRGEDRDDLVQEILLQLWRSFPRYRRERRFSTWMYRVALNTAISFARSTWGRAQRAVALDEADTKPISSPLPHRLELDERVAELYRALDRFGDLDRALLMLHLDERNHREIAEILGISPSNVGTKLHRLKRQLQSELTGKEKPHGIR